VIDAHCHLYDAAEVAEQMHLYDNGGVACVSENLATFERGLELARLWPDRVYLGGALHPANSVATGAAEIEALFDRLEEYHTELTLVGETGLDYKHAVTTEQRQRQQELLQRHFEFAARHRLPVNLHSRRAERPVLEAALVFRNATGLNALMHWFTSSRKLIRQGAAGGLFFTAGPVILDDEQAFKVAGTIPLELLLTETDAPVPFQTGGGRLDAIRLVSARLATYHGLALDEFEETMQRNFRRYLSDPGSSVA